jgi:hypothetical protein
MYYGIPCHAVIVYFEALRLFNGGLQLCVCVCGGGGGGGAVNGGHIKMNYIWGWKSDDDFLKKR